jgi:hypothetical protein
MLIRPTRARVGLFVAGLVAGIAGLSGGVASASAGGADARGQAYVALGDSIAFGYSPLLEDPWIPARFVGYPEIIEQQSGLSATNLACPGQTAQALISRSAVDNGCFDLRDFARRAGFSVLHADYRGTQLEAALDAVRSNAPPALISIQGGGNEISICIEPQNPRRCLDDALPKVAASLRQAVAQLRAAGYRGRVVLVGYHLVPGLEAPLRRMNDVIGRAARQANVAFADAARPFDRYARQRGGDLCTSGLLIKLPDGTCDLHPSLTGQELYAQVVLDAASRDDR